MSQNNHGKTIRLLTVPFTLVLYSQRKAFVFSKQLGVAAAPFKRSSPSMLSVFTKYIPAFYGDMSLQKIHRYGSYLSSFVEDLETPEPCRLYRRFVDTLPIVRPRLRTHFADILKSQLVYTVQLKMIKGGLTLILFFSESMVSFADSHFKFPLLPPSRFS